MYAIREIKQTTSDSLSLKIPKFLQNKKIEVLLFPYEESSHQNLTVNKEKLKTLLSKPGYHLPENYELAQEKSLPLKPCHVAIVLLLQ